jgi:RNA polymerase sigma-70 factor, ECF subfamily
MLRRRTTRERSGDQWAGERTALFATAIDPDAQLFANRLAESLGELPPEQRAVVHLKLWEKLTFDQIAETLGIPANTAASRYRYAIDKLRERLRPIYDEIK